MGQEDLSSVLGRCITDKNFREGLCRIIQPKADQKSIDDKLLHFLRFTGKLGLTENERNFLIENAHQVCECTGSCGKELDIKYNFGGGGDDPKAR